MITSTDDGLLLEYLAEAPDGTREAPQTVGLFPESVGFVITKRIKDLSNHADWFDWPCEDHEDVVAAMRTLDSVLPVNDGVKWFNFLYLNVTEAVQADVSAWQDWPFLQRFDVVFAKLYLEAIIKWEQDESLTPHAWRPLLRARRDARLTRIQFAFAGMNAHINRDLAVALDRMAKRDGRFPSRDGGRYSDFRRVNDILERVEASLREVLATGLVRRSIKPWANWTPSS